MKKHLIALLAMAACLTGCQKDFTTLRITAEAYDGSDAKLHVESLYSCWDNGDTVMINGDEYLVSVSGNNAAIADVEIAGTYRGVYPASMVQDAGDNNVTVNLPTVQRYRTNAAGYQIVDALMAGISQGNGTIQFQNIESLLKITFTPTLSAHIRKIKVQSDNSPLSGTGYLALAEYMNFTTRPDLGCDSVVLDCGLGVAVTENVPADFYIAIPPDINNTHLTITITDDFQSYSHTLTNTLSVGRNTLYTLGFAASAEGVTHTPHAQPLCNQIFCYLDPELQGSEGEKLKNRISASFGTGTDIREFNGKTIITAPYALETIPNGAFADSTSYTYGGNNILTGVTLPEGTKSIGNYAFYTCWQLRTVNLPSTLIHIGAYAFQASPCSTITLPDGLRSIGRRAFQMCEARTINIPDGITRIEDSTFNGACLWFAELPGSVKYIGKHAFDGCTHLKGITLSEGLEEIDEYAFGVRLPFSDHHLYSVSIPSTVTRIGSNAFSECPDMNTITMLPTTAPTIGTDVFPSSVQTILIPQGATGYDQGNWTQYASKIHTENQQ